MNYDSFSFPKVFRIVPLRIKIATVLILGFSLCITTLLYISLSKLTDLYKKTYQTHLHSSLSSATFLLKNFQSDLDQSASRVVGHKNFIDIFKEEDPDLVAVVLQELMASEPLDLGYIVRMKDGRPSVWARSHNLKVVTPEFQQIFNEAIWDKIKQDVDPTHMEAATFQGYLALEGSFFQSDAPGQDIQQKELVYIRALPIMIWGEWRGVAIFGTLLQRSQMLKDRLSEILGVAMDSDLAFQLQFQNADYLSVGHPAVLAKLKQAPNQEGFDNLKAQLEPFPIDLQLFSDRFRLTQEIQNKVLFILSLIGLISFCFLTLLTIFLSKILGSLDDLVATSKLMKKGIYSARMKVTSDDELGVLANHFNDMAKSIEDNLQTIQEQADREKVLRKLHHETEISHLKTQMKPHFLFNTLHMIASLIEMNSEAATEATLLLADLYRQILNSSHTPTSTLKSELDILESYLEIQSMRFGQRLDYSIDADLPTEDIYVPQLTLQTLVENAVKHGIEKSIDGGSIAIKVAQITSQLYEARVSNTGSMVQQKMIERTGLRNTRLMLKHLYGDSSLFTFDNSSPGLVTVSFRFSGEKL